MDPDAEGMCDGPADMDAVKMKFESLTENGADGYGLEEGKR